MNAPVLQAAFDTLAARPALPNFGAAVSAHVEKAKGRLTRELRAYERESAGWRTRLALTERTAAETLLRLEKAPHPAQFDSEAYQLLTNILGLFDSAISAFAPAIEDKTALTNIETLQALSPQHARMMRKLYKEYQDVLAKQHDSLVNIYYRWLALRAEFDPDRGASRKFQTANELDAYLRSLEA